MAQNRTKQDVTINVGERFPLTIRRLGVNGHGIGYFKHKVCFVPEPCREKSLLLRSLRYCPATWRRRSIVSVVPANTGLPRVTLTPMWPGALNLKTSLTRNN